MKTLILLLLLTANDPPPTDCQVTPVYNVKTHAWVNYYSNCGPPSEPSRRDNTSPS